MKKILFLIGSYPSNRSANVLCDEQIIKKLSEINYDISCLVTKSYNTPTYEEVEGIKVYRLHRSLFYNILFWAKENRNRFVSKLIFFIDRIILRVKQIIIIPIYPSITPLYSRKLAKAAIDLYSKDKFDIIVAEYFSFETLYAGYKVKTKFPDVAFIPILWDPLSGGNYAKYLPQKYCAEKSSKYEDIFFDKADVIIVMKSARKHHEIINKNKHFRYKIKYLDNPRIIEHNVPFDSKVEYIEEGRVNVVFAGKLISPERDPSYILDLFNKLNRNDINLIFFGDGNGFDVIEKKKKSFKGKIITPGYIPYERLENILCKADFFLNISGTTTTATASKIFDYMSYGKPIITTYYVDKDASALNLANYPLSLCIDQREPDITKNIRKLNDFLYSKQNSYISISEVKKLFWENTPDAYVSIIDEIYKNISEKED